MAEWTAYRSAVPGAEAVPTASAARGRRPVPRECSSIRSSWRSSRSGRSPPPLPTTAEAGAGRSRSRSTSAVSRAARRPAHSGAAATTAPEASYRAAHPFTCAASAPSTPSGPSASACLVSSRWAAKPGRHRPVLVGRDRRRHRLADGEEGRAARHLQQRQALLLGRVHQRPGNLLVVDPHGEAEPDHPRLGQPPHIAPHGLRVLGVQFERGDQQQLAALHVGHRVRQLADVRPAHRHVQTVLARPYGQLQRGVVDERGERGRHGAFRSRRRSIGEVIFWPLRMKGLCRFCLTVRAGGTSSSAPQIHQQGRRVLAPTLVRDSTACPAGPRGPARTPTSAPARPGGR